MSKLNDLIEELCPEGVHHKPLGEVGVFTRGSGLQKKDFVDDGVGCIHYGQVFTHYGLSATRTISFVTPEFAKNKRRVRPGDVFIATTSENDEDLGKAVAWLGNEEIVASGDGYIFHHELVAEYVSYFLNSASFQQQKKRWITGTKVRRISGAALESIVIPVPPLPVQQEIVRILDQFTQLETELEAREAQYNYHRTHLLSEISNYQSVLLGDIAEIGTGSHDTKDAIPDGEYIFYARGRRPLRLGDYDFDEKAIITAGDGVGVGKVFHFATGRYALHQRAYRIVPQPGVNPRYIYHYLVNGFSRYVERTSVHASVTSLRRPMFLKYPVMLPSLEEQNRIADILDLFEEFVGDLSVGLPAEIAARRKQYEYYRDRLLTFKELSA